jgi:transposase
MRNRYLRPSWDLPEIYLYRAPIDFRKHANGLALLVEQELGHSPFSGALYAFTNRQRNKIKCLM